MYEILRHAHSGLRWIVLLLLLAAIFNAFRKMRAGAAYEDADRRLSLFALIAVHLQLVLGLILYFISPYVSFVEGFMKDSVLRFYSVEHAFLMIIAIALITVGYSRAKRKTQDVAKFKTTFNLYLIGLILILVSIPWPFRGLGAGWF